MPHLAISLFAYVLYFVAKTLMPTQSASWHHQRIARRPQL